MQIIKNELVGYFAVPKDHPITSGNPAPWQITEMRIEVRACDNVVISIRGDNSMWFSLKNCIVGDKDELEDYVEIQARKRLLETTVRYVSSVRL